MENEIWKDIPDSQGAKVSNMGGFQSHTGKVFHYNDNPKEYRRSVGIKTKKGIKTKALARLISEAFHGPCPKGYVVNHKDRRPWNNLLSNLECIPRRKDALHWKNFPPPKEKAKNITIRCNSNILNKIKDMANKKDRAFSEMVVRILTKYFQGSLTMGPPLHYNKADVVIGARVPIDFYNRIKNAAAEADRSVSNFITNILSRAI